MSIIMSIIVKSQEEHLKLIFSSHRSTIVTDPVLPGIVTLNGCLKISTCSYVSWLAAAQSI